MHLAPTCRFNTLSLSIKVCTIMVFCLPQSEELQDRIDNMDPELFVGEPDAPAEPDAIDGLLDGALPGTAGFQENTDAQVDFIRDILPEGDDALEPDAAYNGDARIVE